MKKIKAFTLAEIMIVLTVIGILTAMLLPIAFRSGPEENVLKFKKAHANFYKVIQELAGSGQYYMAGDLGSKPYVEDFSIKGASAVEAFYNTYRVTDTTYFCKTVAEVLSAKTVDCSTAYGTVKSYIDVRGTGNQVDLSKIKTASGTNVDARCAAVQKDTIKADKQIVTADGVVWFEESSNTPFGIYNTGTTRLFSNSNGATRDANGNMLIQGLSPRRSLVSYADADGFDAIYKIYCIDVDGYSGPEAPFGYAVRADGTIQTGARADEWIAKTVQKQ